MSLAEAAVLAALVVGLAACARDSEPAAPAGGLDAIAERYVKLVLAVGQHDDAYVDAYYGPGAWREEAEAQTRPLAALAAEADSLRDALGALAPAEGDEMTRLRHQYLQTQLGAVAARVAMLQGQTMTFDEEARALYDTDPPHYDEAHFQRLLGRLDDALPGDGPVPARYERFKADFVIPPDRLDAVFTAAIEEARRRTRAHMTQPEDERFTVEYVTDKPWSGYNWYQGGGESLIQVNTDLPIYIDRAVDLAAHEGYPGHHVYNALLEQHLVRDRGWVEFSVYPLFSPQSLIAEGSANYGIEVAFPQAERLAFERDVLFPLAGLDPARAEDYYAVEALASELSYAGNEAARRYLDGTLDADSAAAFLTAYALMPPARAAQRVRFIDAYRSYVINYNWGQDLVRGYVEARGGADDPARRWAVFADLLASPRLPSGLE
ncbi:MAG: hypothetical protein R3247_04000 [Rhodothermales bacterium]|nr:hypothetical protein [Rhodothermales bacterium]